MRRTYKHILPAMLACSAILFSCSDWTDTESLDIHIPTIEEQNPELYARYVQSLNEYKASEHKVVIASVNNLSTMPSSRSQRLVDMPDSLDYICLNNILAVNEMNVSEMKEVRKLGTKVLGLIDFDAIESAWKRILDEEANTPADSETPEEGEGEEPIDNESRFIVYCQREVVKRINIGSLLGVDGFIANFTGFDLNVLSEEGLAAERDRQAAFFDAIDGWRTATNEVLIFKGVPQNVVDRAILSDCKYIILNAHSAKSISQMSYVGIMASVADVPTDRFIIGVTTPYTTISGAIYGTLSNNSSAIVGAAQWAIAGTDDFTKVGISIDNAEQDYYNVSKIYTNTREAINILSPTVN